MAFRDPEFAGPTLVRAALQSANFVTGQSGWQIRQNGGAEFNGATFRGSALIEGGGQAVLIYPGAPAPGNLLISLAGVAGTDSAGNGYPAGLGLEPGAPAFFRGTVPGVSTDASLQLTALGSGTTAHSILAMGSAQDSTQLDAVEVVVGASSADGTVNAQATVVYVDPSGGVHNYVSVTPAGAALTGTITAVHPGTGTRAAPGVAESWQSIAFNAGWASGPHFGVAQGLHYRLDAETGYGYLYGSCATTSATPSATLFTLAAGYYNAVTAQRVPCMTYNGTTLAPNMLLMDTSGNVTLQVPLSASGVDVDIAARYRLV